MCTNKLHHAYDFIVKNIQEQMVQWYKKKS